jgi:hypothetical protein
LTNELPSSSRGSSCPPQALTPQGKRITYHGGSEDRFRLSSVQADRRQVGTGKLETINEDITHILHTILDRPPIKKTVTPKLNSSKESKLNVSKKAINRINELYESDFQLFEYSFL